MRGTGGVFRRGPVWWIRYSHRGRKYRSPASRRIALSLISTRAAEPKALKWSRARVNNLGAMFARMRAVDITAARIREFAAARLEEGKAAGTVNRDLGVLRRMFILGIQSGKLSRRPHLGKLTEAPPRQGFMEHADYLAIRRHLPADHQDILHFAYLTGWRRGEVLGLEWCDVDRASGVIRLRPEMGGPRPRAHDTTP